MFWELLSLIFFLSLAVLFFTIPGVWIYNQITPGRKGLEDLAIATVIGFSLFTLLGYLLLFFKSTWLLLFIFILIDLLAVKQIRFNLPNLKKGKSILLLLVFIVGITGQLLVIAPSGQEINGTVVFWSAHGHDGVWHLALIEQIKNGFPLYNPDFAGQKLVNYHFFSDISSAIFSNFFHFNGRDLYFRFFPSLFSVLLGVLSFQLGKLIGKSDQAGFWAMFFTFFAGSFGFLVTLIRDGSIGGENLFWSTQIQSVSGNPPQAIAVIIILSFILLFTDYILRPSKRIGLCLILLCGTLAEFKIYGAVILLLSLFLVSCWFLLKNKSLVLMAIFLGSSLLTLLLYLPNTAGSQNLLIFEPWWFIRTMIVAQDKLNWIDLEHKRQTYLAAHSYLRVAQIEIEGLLIFLMGNLGIRFLGVWQIFKLKFLVVESYLFIFSILLFSLIFPLLFIQKAIPGNTIQFFLYFLLIFGILAGVSTAQLLKKVKSLGLKILIILLIFLLAIPTQIGTLNTFYSRPPFTKISSAELAALDYLNKNSNPEDVVISPPFHQGFDSKNPLPPIWIWSDTSYLPAFSSRRTFITDIEQLDIMGYDYKPRQSIQLQIFTTPDPNLFDSLLKQNNIKFIYFPKPQRPKVDLAKTKLQNIFVNNEVELWKVN